MGHSEQIQHRDNHVEMGDQNGLGKVRCELFVMGAEAFEEAWGGLLEVLGVDLGKVRADFKPLVKLESSQFPYGNTAHELPQVLFSKLQKHVR